jgi:eukaryotic-like serine/threonine-protein kinase
MSGPDQDDERFTFTGPSLDADGKLSQRTPAGERMQRIERASPAPRRPEALELEERPARADTDYVPAPPPPPVRIPTRVPWLLVFTVLLAAALAVGYLARGRPRSQRPLPSPVVFITSEPPGATVRVEGTEVGTTPWAADNAWGPGAVHVELSRAGYRTWSGTFGGGAPARIEVRLQKR